jgi:Protein of unknown function (DUF2937)
MVLRRLAIAIGLLFGLLGSQLPEFAQQYRQRLGGALDELKRMIGQFDTEVAARSLNRSQGLDRLEKNNDPLARERGEAIAGEIDRADRLQRQQEAMRNAGPLARVAALAENFDAPTLRQAIEDFEPAIPVTTEAFVIGGVALILGWSTTHFFAWPIRRKWGRGQKEASTKASCKPALHHSGRLTAQRLFIGGRWAGGPLRRQGMGGAGGYTMSDDLTNDQIALLCDIGEFNPSKQTEDKKSDLERLICENYVEQTESHPGSAFKLTAKGVEFLGKRGAGLNEA